MVPPRGAGLADAGAHGAELAVVDRPVEHLHVGVHHPPRAVIGLALGLEEVGRHHRRDHARHGQAHQDRNDHGEAEVLEELARYARHQRHRQEHRHDGEGRRHHGQPDLVRGIDRCLVGALAHAHMAHDVLDLHDRIVDQHPRDQPQREQRHGVEREAHQVHEIEGRDGRQRDCQRRDDRCAPVPQEQEHHDHGQDRAFHHGRHRAFVLAAGIVHLREQAGELDARVLCLQILQHLDRAVIDRNVAFAAGAGDREGHHLPPVDLGQRTDFAIGIAHFGNVRQLDRAAAADGNLRLRQLEGSIGIAEHADRLARTGNLCLAAGCIDIGLPQRRIDRRRSNAKRLHFRRIENDQDFTVHPAVAVDLCKARHRQQRLCYGIVDEPAQFLDRHVIGGHAKVDDRLGTRLLLGNARFEDAVGQFATDLVDRTLHLVHGFRDVGADGEFDLRVGAALARGRTDVLHPVERLDRCFHPLGDLVLDLARRSAGLRDLDDHHREFDVRGILHIHPVERQDARQHQAEEGQQRDDRVTDRPGGDVAEVHAADLIVRPVPAKPGRKRPL